MIDLEKFSAFLRKTNKSANTVTSYCFAARQYTTHFGEFTKKNLLLYKAFLIERFKPKTVNIRLLAMNAYATCISKPTLKMPLIRIQQKPFLENVISDADYAYFKRKLNNPAERYWYFVIRFLAATGARISELLQLKVEHITAGHIDIYSKGGKMRRIYIPQKLKDEALSWLATRDRVQRDIYAESKGFTRRERKGSCRAVDLPQVSDEVGEELLEAVRLVEGAQRQQRLRSLQRPEHS